MATIECSRETPWGIHLFLREDVACPRCGWADAERRAEVAAARARRMRESWTLVGQAA
jgi:hypothetical protein